MVSDTSFWWETSNAIMHHVINQTQQLPPDWYNRNLLQTDYSYYWSCLLFVFYHYTWITFIQPDTWSYISYFIWQFSWVLYKEGLTIWFVEQHTTLHYTTLHYTTLHHTTLHYTTLHYTTIQYNTIQHNTIQYNSILYNTITNKPFVCLSSNQTNFNVNYWDSQMLK